MSTKKKPEEEKSETAVAVKTSTGELANYDYGEQAGEGWENTDASDFKIPFINQLQSLSAELDEGEDCYIEGAKAGMLINSVTKQLYPEELFIVPVMTDHCFVEWIPRTKGGGFVGIHALDSAVIKQARATATSQDLVSEAGNDLVETYYMYVLILSDPNDLDANEMAVMSFTITKVKRYKECMTTLRTLKGSGNIPLFANRLKVSTTREKNKSGQTYFNINISPAINSDTADSLISPKDNRKFLGAAGEFRKGVAAGALRADMEGSSGTPNNSGGNDASTSDNY